MNNLTHKYLDELTYEVLGSAIEVHKVMGIGLLESVYLKCMIEELKLRKINFLTEHKIPVNYKNVTLDIDFRCDLFIENFIVVELKAVSELNSMQEAQLLNYMKLLKAPKGILINFNSLNIFKFGQKTLVNEFFKSLPKQ
jgi:GxxExxY protein